MEFSRLERSEVSLVLRAWEDVLARRACGKGVLGQVCGKTGRVRLDLEEGILVTRCVHHLCGSEGREFVKLRCRKRVAGRRMGNVSSVLELRTELGSRVHGSASAAPAANSSLTFRVWSVLYLSPAH